MRETTGTADALNLAAGVARAVSAAGGIPQLAFALGLDRTGVWRWKRVPAEQCGPIEKLYGVPRAVLRPDLFGVEA